LFAAASVPFTILISVFQERAAMAELHDPCFNSDLSNADFTGAYLTGADFTGANVHGATVEGATLTGVKGLDQSPIGGSAR